MVMRTGRERWHGTVSGYRDKGCRCAPCRASVSTVTSRDERDEMHRQHEAAAHELHQRSQYRQGSRTPAAIAAHNRDTTERRRRLVREQFAGIEERLLAMLADGRQLQVACDKLGVKSIAALRRADWDEEWGKRLDAALMAGRDPGLKHGTAWCHRVYGCRCPECREAKRIESGPRR